MGKLGEIGWIRTTYYLVEKIASIIPDRTYLEIVFFLRMGRKLKLDEPESFSDKIQWLKLNDRKMEYVNWVDKVKAKERAESIIGAEYIIPTIGVWERFEDIDFDTLPNEFVIKCNHDSGGVVVCKDKANLNWDEVKRIIERQLKRNYYYNGREWPYSQIKRKILIEKFIGSKSEQLMDYKLMVFNGQVKCSFVCTDRESKKLKVTFFDRNWVKMPFERKYPADEKKIEKPKNYNKMIELAETIAKNWIFARVDFYESDEQLYFGEVTFYPGSGMEKFKPEEWDYKLGKLLMLP